MTPVWVVVLVAAVAPVTTVLATWLTLRYTNQRERDRREHEEALKVLELESQRQDKEREERLAAYRTLLAITKNINSRAPYDFADLTEALAEIELVSDNLIVVQAGRDLVASCNEARKAATDAYKEDPNRIVADVPEARQAVWDNERRWRVFMGKAIEDRKAMSELRGAKVPQAGSERRWWRRVFGS